MQIGCSTRSLYRPKTVPKRRSVDLTRDPKGLFELHTSISDRMVRDVYEYPLKGRYTFDNYSKQILT